MIVWVASFPRSGNTFLRILLHRTYGIRTSTVYDVDGVAQRVGGELVGFEERPGDVEALRAADALHFVKTHRPRHDDVDPATDRAIAIVRDGRDALVSWARLRIEGTDRTFPGTGRTFEDELAALLDVPGTTNSGPWGDHVLSWLAPGMPGRHLIRFDDLVADPQTVLHTALAAVAPERRPAEGVDIPTFDELHAHDPGFFRRGRTGTHVDELPPDLHARFWAHGPNAEAMAALGFGRGDT